MGIGQWKKRGNEAFLAMADDDSACNLAEFPRRSMKARWAAGRGTAMAMEVGRMLKQPSPMA